MFEQTPRLDRATGVLLASAAGDALGWPQELQGNIVGGKKTRLSADPQPQFVSWLRNGGNRFSGVYPDPVAAGEYSDDTQLTCSVARAALRGADWLEWLRTVEFPSWTLYQRGGGAAVLRAANSWAQGVPPWDSGETSRKRASAIRFRAAGGNGVAMRISPHVLWVEANVVEAEREQVLIERVMADGMNTHGHPRALIGALVYGAALSFALGSRETVGYGELVKAAREGAVAFERIEHTVPEQMWSVANVEDYRREWEEVRFEVHRDLDLVEESLSRGAMSDDADLMRSIGGLGRSGGAGTTTVVGAVYFASRAAARPLSGLLSAAFLQDADTDTLASLVGGLLGAIHGTAWLRPLSQIQDREYLSELAADLVTGSNRAQKWPEVPVVSAKGPFIDDLFSERPSAVGVFPDGRTYRVLKVENISTDGRAARASLMLDDGQSILVDHVRARLRPSAAVEPKERRTGRLATEHRSDAHPLRVQTVLLTPDVAGLTRYYARLLDVELEVQARELIVHPTLRFREVEGQTSGGNGGVVVEFLVADVERAAILLGSVVDRTRGRASAAGFDPDGRTVRVSAR
jgi:ADP-ribosylglycohydrolase